MFDCGCGHKHAERHAKSSVDGQKRASSPDGVPKRGPDEGPFRITGTWDFKWVPGTTIRIAVQDLPAGENHVELQQAIAGLRAGLNAWVPEDGSGANLRWEVLEELMPAPDPAPDGPGLARSSAEALRKRPFVAYDVLVSFAKLPMVIPATSEREKTEVNYPRCELGTYARRVEYGLPTLYLGPHQGFQGTDPEKQLEPEQAAKEWRLSPEGRFTLIHELGHLFGLVHEQQNPLFQGELDWRPIEQMVEMAALRNKPTPPPGVDKAKGEKELRKALKIFLEAEILERWVGDTRFSDWRAPPEMKADRSVDFDSVMAKPVYLCFLNGEHGTGYDCTKKHICEVEQREFSRLVQPTASDLAQLVAMYGVRP